MEYSANGQRFSYLADGQKSWGQNVILLDHALDLTAGTSWHQQGYVIEKLFDDSIYQTFITNTKDLLLRCWTKAGLDVPENFQLQNYHTLITDQESHLRAVDKTKLLFIQQFPVPVKLLEERISELCKTKLITQNPFDKLRVFHFRVVRPGKTDNNPLHRDVWLEDYDDCINLYIPIAGSNELTSLMIIPESHLWSESSIERTVSGAQINNLKFNVPAVTAINRDFHVVRPSPHENEVLIFSPYLIHGGSVNCSPDQTRISIEIRLWKSKID